MRRQSAGFTIVELLIVIVVIAILAAVTIVAYNGIQTRARASSVSSSLTQAAKKIAMYHIDNSAYPTSLSAVGMTDTNNISYQYRTTGTGYCLTATSGAVSYKVTEASPPNTGSCTITNLAVNPSFETNLTAWGPTWAGATLTRVSSGGGITSGSYGIEATIGTANAAGFSHTIPGLAANTPYTASAYVTLMSGDPSSLMIHASDGAGTRAYTIISPVLTVNDTKRLTLTWTSSANTASTTVTIMRNGVSSGSAVVRLDALLVDQGLSVNTYADGNSAGWSWSGSVNNSSSSGPPL